MNGCIKLKKKIEDSLFHLNSLDRCILKYLKNLIRIYQIKNLKDLCMYKIKKTLFLLFKNCNLNYGSKLVILNIFFKYYRYLVLIINSL